MAVQFSTPKSKDLTAYRVFLSSSPIHLRFGAKYALRHPLVHCIKPLLGYAVEPVQQLGYAVEPVQQSTPLSDTF